MALKNRLLESLDLLRDQIKEEENLRTCKTPTGNYIVNLLQIGILIKLKK